MMDNLRTLAGGGGFEPPLTGPEPVVLPLDDPPAQEHLIIGMPREGRQRCLPNTSRLENLYPVQVSRERVPGTSCATAARTDRIAWIAYPKSGQLGTNL